MYELISIVACPAAELQLELATNIRKVSQCPEKASLPYVKLGHLSTKIIKKLVAFRMRPNFMFTYCCV